MLQKTLSILAVAVILLCSPAYTQQPVDAPEMQVTESQDGVDETRDGIVSLNFHDVDIKDVLRVLSYESNINIVAGPEVTGLVSIQLDSVPWKRALDVIVETYGYAYDQRENIITVTTVENLKKRREDAMLLSDQEALVTRAFVLNYPRPLM